MRMRAISSSPRAHSILLTCRRTSSVREARKPLRDNNHGQTGRHLCQEFWIHPPAHVTQMAASLPARPSHGRPSHGRPPHSYPIGIQITHQRHKRTDVLVPRSALRNRGSQRRAQTATDEPYPYGRGTTAQSTEGHPRGRSAQSIRHSRVWRRQGASAGCHQAWRRPIPSRR